jgi:hypothetical protein
MKQLIRLVHLRALTALYIALCGTHRQTQATETIPNRYPKKPDRPAEPRGELVLLGLDGTVIAREVNLAPHPLSTRSAADRFSDPARDRQRAHASGG